MLNDQTLLSCYGFLKYNIFMDFFDKLPQEQKEEFKCLISLGQLVI